MTDEEKSYGHFMQDSVQTANKPMDALDEDFRE
jgi:hypothetical protein